MQNLSYLQALDQEIDSGSLESLRTVLPIFCEASQSIVHQRPIIKVIALIKRVFNKAESCEFRGDTELMDAVLTLNLFERATMKYIPKKHIGYEEAVLMEYIYRFLEHCVGNYHIHPNYRLI